MAREFRLSALSLFTGILLLSSSCSEEFLTREPPGVGAGSVIMDPDGVGLLLTGAYASLRGGSMFGGSLCTDWVWGSLSSARPLKLWRMGFLSAITMSF